MNTIKPMKMNNLPLSDFDQNDLKKIITDKVTMMIAGNLDRWMPGVSRDQSQRNVNNARTTASCIAQRVLNAINSAEKGPQLRDLSMLLVAAAPDAEIILADGDTEETIRMDENPSFAIALASCADQIILDLVLEPA